MGSYQIFFHPFSVLNFSSKYSLLISWPCRIPSCPPQPNLVNNFFLRFNPVVICLGETDNIDKISHLKEIWSTPQFPSLSKSCEKYLCYKINNDLLGKLRWQMSLSYLESSTMSLIQQMMLGLPTWRHILRKSIRQANKIENKSINLQLIANLKLFFEII